MIMAGTKHFKGNLEQVGNGDDAATIYKALRLYNSGQVDESNLNDDNTGNGGSDPNYVRHREVTALTALLEANMFSTGECDCQLLAGSDWVVVGCC